ncbi:MAG TPA: diadenylate cyclase CdaA [Terriglobia bacterium]|nr:diadenylate cyclase CdaA [Terriglobia bacterium]
MPELMTFARFNAVAVIDILIVAVLIYRVLAFMKGTRAVQMAIGIALLIAFFYVSRWSRLVVVSWLMTTTLPYFAFAVIVIFQPEIRRALAQFGRASIFPGLSAAGRAEFYDVIALAVTTLAARKTGALIVIERGIGLKGYIESGIAMDARLSYDLLVTLFHRDVPMHDGAVIVQRERVAAAACFLPLTVKPRLSQELGTRHRAAIGVTEETDAIAIVVSEETGAISLARDGEIERFLDASTLKIRLRQVFEQTGRNVSARSTTAGSLDS